MIGNVNREIETLRNTQKKKQEIKNTETEMKNTLSGGWIELWKESVTMKMHQKKPLKPKCKGKNRWKKKKKKNIQKLCNFKRCGTCNWNSWRRKRKLSRQHIWSNSGQEFSKINDRYQTTNPDIKESKQKYSLKNLHIGLLYSNFRRSKAKNL